MSYGLTSSCWKSLISILGLSGYIFVEFNFKFGYVGLWDLSSLRAIWLNFFQTALFASYHFGGLHTKMRYPLGISSCLTKSYKVF